MHSEYFILSTWRMVVTVYSALVFINMCGLDICEMVTQKGVIV